MSHVIPLRLVQMLNPHRWNCNVFGWSRKVTEGKLRAKCVWRLSSRRPRVPWLGPCLEARPGSPTLRPLRLGVCRADDGGFAPLEASPRRVAGVSHLYCCNSPRLLAVRSKFGTVRLRFRAVWRSKCRPPRRQTPTTWCRGRGGLRSGHNGACPRVRPHIRHVGALTPPMKQPPSRPTFPCRQAESRHTTYTFCPVVPPVDRATSRTGCRADEWGRPARVGPIRVGGGGWGTPPTGTATRCLGGVEVTPQPTFGYMPPSTCATTILPTMATGYTRA